MRLREERRGVRGLFVLALGVATTAGGLVACSGSNSDPSVAGGGASGGGSAGASLMATPQAPLDVDHPAVSELRGSTRQVGVELTEGTNMAATPSPDGPQIAFTAQGALWVDSDRRRQGDADHDRRRRADGAGLVARRLDHRVPELHHRRQLPHLDDQPGRRERQGDDHRLLRRSRAGLDARRLGPRVRVRPQQRRPVQDLELHAWRGNLYAAHDGARRREQPGGLTGRQADRLRRHQPRVHRADLGGGAPTLVGPAPTPAWARRRQRAHLPADEPFAQRRRQGHRPPTRTCSRSPRASLPNGRFLYTADGKLKHPRRSTAAGLHDVPFTRIAHRATAGVSRQAEGSRASTTSHRAPPRASARR